MHPDQISTFTQRSKDHQDFLHNGFLVMTQAVANLKTLLMSGGAAGGVTTSMSFPKQQMSTCFGLMWPPTSPHGNL